MQAEKNVLRDAELEMVSGGTTYMLKLAVSSFTGKPCIMATSGRVERVASSDGTSFHFIKESGSFAIPLNKFETWRQKHPDYILINTKFEPFSL